MNFGLYMTYWVDIVGFGAAFCTTVSFVPQALKVLKTRDTAALSLMMYCIFTLGVVLWLLYGIFRGDWAIIVANCITLCLALCILLVKIHSDVLPGRAGKRTE